jgi:putative membrane protein
MSTLSGGNPGADLRDYLAEERTFLAWIRTGLALMGFGFVVARFGLFLQELQITRAGSEAPISPVSLCFGTALIAAGIAVNLSSTWRHFRLIEELNRGEFVGRRPPKQAVVLGVFLALVGLAMAIYLVLAFYPHRPGNAATPPTPASCPQRVSSDTAAAPYTPHSEPRFLEVDS